MIITALIFSTPALYSADLSKYSASVSSGICFDVTKTGIEQCFAVLQGEFLLPGSISLGLKPILVFNTGTFIFRFPVLGKLRLSAQQGDFTAAAYCGAGPEYYKSAEHEEISPVLTGGLSLEAGLFYLDVPAAVAFREYNIDADLSLTAGVVLGW